MEQSPPEEKAPHNPNLLAGVMGLFKNMLGLVLNRIELAALEFSEVRTNLLKLTLYFALGLMAVWFAVAYWSALLVYLTWDTLGWKILLFIASGFTVLAIGLIRHACGQIAQGKLSMPATMDELRNDRDALL